MVESVDLFLSTLVGAVAAEWTLAAYLPTAAGLTTAGNIALINCCEQLHLLYNFSGSLLLLQICGIILAAVRSCQWNPIVVTAQPTKSLSRAGIGKRLRNLNLLFNFSALQPCIRS